MSFWLYSAFEQNLPAFWKRKSSQQVGTVDGCAGGGHGSKQLVHHAGHRMQRVQALNRRGVHFRVLNLGIDSRTLAGKITISVFSSFQYQHENDRQKSLARIKLAKQQGRPAGRDAEQVAKALEKGLSVAERVTRTGISRASVKRYRQELTTTAG